MRHITILYGHADTGKVYICQQAGWALVDGTVEQMKAFLESNLSIDELAVPIDTQEDQGIFLGPVRAMLHAHARANGYIVRYIDTRIT